MSKQPVIAPTSQPLVVLNGHSSWHAWYSMIKFRAIGNGTWDLINPEATEEVVNRKMIKEPVYPTEYLTEELTAEAERRLNRRIRVHQIELEKFKQQSSALNDIRTATAGAISIQYINYIADKKTTRYEQPLFTCEKAGTEADIGDLVERFRHHMRSRKAASDKYSFTTATSTTTKTTFQGETDEKETSPASNTDKSKTKKKGF